MLIRGILLRVLSSLLHPVELISLILVNIERIVKEQKEREVLYLGHKGKL